MEYISPLQNERSDRGGCDGYEIDRRYSKNSEVLTHHLIMKYNVRFTLTIIYVMLHF